MQNLIKLWFAHPMTRKLDIDDPKTTELRRKIVRQKEFLRKIYEEWYSAIVSSLSGVNRGVLELGSGGGFLNEWIPGLITSECFPCCGVDSILDAQTLPFKDSSLRGIVMINVLHHLPYPREFLRESIRCLMIGGRIVMIEPWVTPWSRFVYKRVHYEAFDPASPEWGFHPTGHLSGANGAQPWIIFQRDRRTFEQEFSELRLEMIKLMMPVRYLMSGGVTSRDLLPAWMYSVCGLIEHILSPWINQTAMFAIICLKRTT